MASSHSSFHEHGVAGILFAPLKWCFVATLLLFALITMAWIVDWMLVTRVWVDGIIHLQQSLALEMKRAERIGNTWADYPEFARVVTNGLYEIIFGLTGVQDMGLRFSQSTPVSIPDNVLRNTYVANYEAIRSAMISTQVFGLRLVALVLVLPTFLTAYAVAVTDGLTRRAIRRAGGGRESASLYHRAKRLQLILGVTLVSAWLLMPMTNASDWYWQVGIVLLAVLAGLQWTYYKKHL